MAAMPCSKVNLLVGHHIFSRHGYHPYRLSLFPFPSETLNIFKKRSKTQDPIPINHHLPTKAAVLESMADYSYNHNRSKSYGGPNTMRLQPYYGPPPQSHGDLRFYSASFTQTDMWATYSNNNLRRDLKLKKAKSTPVSTSKSWGFTNPEFQRKKRVASYKMYAVQGKVKVSFRKSLRWLKDRFSFSLK